MVGHATIYPLCVWSVYCYPLLSIHCLCVRSVMCFAHDPAKNPNQEYIESFPRQGLVPGHVGVLLDCRRHRTICLFSSQTQGIGNGLIFPAHTRTGPGACFQSTAHSGFLHNPRPGFFGILHREFSGSQCLFLKSPEIRAMNHVNIFTGIFAQRK